LTKTDDTNVTLTLGGSPTTSLLAATSLTLGWTGTLAAARLNANVVQSVVNDTNVTGSIAAQALTLGWTGTLSVARGGTAKSSWTANGIVYASGTTTLANGTALTFDGTNLATTGTASATKFIPTGGTATGNGMYLPAANSLGFSTNGAEVARIDSSGNFGLSVTPSAWRGAFRVLSVGGAGASYAAANAFPNAIISANMYDDTTEKYVSSSNKAAKYVANGNAGQHEWYVTNTTGTAGNAITFTQAMTLDASGNLLVGTTSGSGKLYVETSSPPHAVLRNPSGASYTSLRLYNDQNTSGRALEIDYFGSTASGGERAEIATTGAYPLCFLTTNTERMRLDSSGNLGIGVTPSASAYKTVELTGIAITGINATDGRIYGNAYESGGGAVYKTSSFATLYKFNAGSHIWYTAASGTAGNAITYTQAMTLDTSSNLLVGTTSTSGTMSNTAKVLGGSFSTFTGSTSLPSATATTIATIPSGTRSSYLVTISLNVVDAVNYGAAAIIVVDNSSASLATIKTGALMTLTMSGLNIQATQGAATTNTGYWSVTRLNNQ
jgi:hypothetical protein